MDNNLDFINGDLPSCTDRTLVQNNLTYANGGFGIHTNASWRVDIVNNTAYENAQPNLATGTSAGYPQIFAGYASHDVNIINNVMWARYDPPINSTGVNSSGINHAYNVYSGNGANPAPSPGNASGANVGNTRTFLTASDVFVASYDGVPNFKLKPFSGLTNGPSSEQAVPGEDRDGNPCPLGTGTYRSAFKNL